MQKQSAFQIDVNDNVATALDELQFGNINIIGDVLKNSVKAIDKIPKGHKISICDIPKGDHIIKYGTVIGRSTADIKCGTWVHLHVMESLYDNRSEHLDILTGTPKDIEYD